MVWLAVARHPAVERYCIEWDIPHRFTIEFPRQPGFYWQGEPSKRSFEIHGGSEAGVSFQAFMPQPSIAGPIDGSPG
jgi:hypothetical protein